MASELFKLLGTISVDATSATTNINAVISAGKDLEKKLNEIGAGADNSIGEKSGFSTAAVWLGNTLNQLAAKVWDLGLDFVSLGFKFNASAETYKASIKAMLGLTDEETDALYEKLYDFAKETPYNMASVMESAIKLFNAGMNSDETLRTLAVLGDLAGGNSEKMTRLIKAYTDTMGYGFLRAQERNQFVENEVLLYQLLADYYEATGKGVFTADQIAQMQSDKEISDEDVWAALEYATSEEGRYYNYAATLMETWAGKTEKFSDDLNEAAGAITEPFFNVIKDETIDKLAEVLNAITEWANENPEVLNNLAIALSDLAVNGIEVLLDGLEKLVDFWDTNQGIFNLMLTALGGIAIASGHPYAGVALLAAAGNDGLEELYMNEDGTYKTNMLFPGVSEALNRSAENEGKEAGRYSYFSDQARAIAESLWDMQRLGLNGTDVSGFETLMTQMYDEFGKIATEMGVENTEYAIVSLLTDLVNQMSTLDNSTENLPDDWFYDPNGDKPTDWMDLRQTPDPEALVGSTDSIHFLAEAVQALITDNQSMEERITGAVETAMSNVTITGYVTTGNVMLDKSTIVGTLAPEMNLQFGTLTRLSDRG